ncbi:hypothetical protein KSP35_12215 [Aquihabitans sp. G128]|uniref:hypothetical protein n=1 Tax=Aquihabitans sp. G128 TaxID=2849779 RepID=UPI001C24B77E|nr:hypothetical protein [Aquihabitans sp. G128]QXC59175.1 hypothetical protein KSP35_12215 [Aquihabitans sp. G128]
MEHLRLDREQARRLLAAGLALAVLAAFWTLVTTTPLVRTIADHTPHARSIELPAGAQDSVQYRSGALRTGPRLTLRNDLDQLASRLLATWAAAAFLVLAGSWWTRLGRIDVVRTSVVPRVGLRLRGPPA